MKFIEQDFLHDGCPSHHRTNSAKACIES